MNKTYLYYIPAKLIAHNLQSSSFCDNLVCKISFAQHTCDTLMDGHLQLYNTLPGTIVGTSSIFTCLVLLKYHCKNTDMHHLHCFKYRQRWLIYRPINRFEGYCRYNTKARYWLISPIYCPISRYSIWKPLFRYEPHIQYLKSWSFTCFVIMLI